MTTVKIVRYTTAPEHADTNEQLVRDVYAELADTAPEGLRYATFRLDDRAASCTSPSSEGEDNPLNSSARVRGVPGRHRRAVHRSTGRPGRLARRVVPALHRAGRATCRLASSHLASVQRDTPRNSLLRGQDEPDGRADASTRQSARSRTAAGSRRGVRGSCPGATGG